MAGSFRFRGVSRVAVAAATALVIAVPGVSPAEEFRVGEFYAGGGIGAAVNSGFKVRESRTIDSGVVVGQSADFGRSRAGPSMSMLVGGVYGGLRVEGELSYEETRTGSENLRISVTGQAPRDVGAKVRTRQGAGTVNVLYDIVPARPFGVYVGAGVGIAVVEKKTYASGGSSRARRTRGLIRGIAGVEYRVMPDIRVGVRYSYGATRDVSVDGSDIRNRSHRLLLVLVADM